jgi:hypothetical protein
MAARVVAVVEHPSDSDDDEPRTPRRPPPENQPSLDL